MTCLKMDNLLVRPSAVCTEPRLNNVLSETNNTPVKNNNLKYQSRDFRMQEMLQYLLLV